MGNVNLNFSYLKFSNKLPLIAFDERSMLPPIATGLALCRRSQFWLYRHL